MTTSEIESLLKPGDCLLYAPTGFYGWIIQSKTWHRVGHVEIYVGNGRSTASRNGIGVGLYPWRNTELAYVLRPTRSDTLDWIGFWKWFRTVNGQGYDWLGLLRFAWFKDVKIGGGDRMFCSPFAARAYRALNACVFGDAEDADAIAPFEFLLSPNLTIIATTQSLAS